MRNVVSLAEKRHDPDALLTAAEVGTWLGCSARTVQRAKLPAVHIGKRTTRYLVSAVKEWIASQVRAA